MTNNMIEYIGDKAYRIFTIKGDVFYVEQMKQNEKGLGWIIEKIVFYGTGKECIDYVNELKENNKPVTC